VDSLHVSASEQDQGGWATTTAGIYQNSLRFGRAANDDDDPVQKAILRVALDFYKRASRL